MAIFSVFLPIGIIKPRSQGQQVFGLIEILQSAPSIFLCSLLFGISTGCIDATLWARFKELGLEAPFAFGLIQAGFSVSRIIGIEFWKLLGFRDSRKLILASLLSSSVVYLIFPFVDQPIIAATIWLIRVLFLSAFFGSMSSLILDSFRKEGSGATALSVNSVIGAIGGASATMAIGSFGGTISIFGVLIIGALFSLGAGAVQVLHRSNQL